MTTEGKTIPSKAQLAIEALALYPLAFLANIPHAISSAAADGLPGDTERIIATAAAGALGFWAAAIVLLLWNRRSPRRWLYCAALLAAAGALAFRGVETRPAPAALETAP